MVTWMAMFFVLTVSALVQLLLPAWSMLGQAKCPFLLAAVLYYALSREVPFMLAAALAGGLLQDALGSAPLGYTPVLFLIVGGLSVAFRASVLPDALTTRLTFGGVAALAMTLLTGLLFAHAGEIGWTVRQLVWKPVCTGILGALCTPWVFAVVHRFEKGLGLIEEREGVDGLA